MTAPPLRSPFPRAAIGILALIYFVLARASLLLAVPPSAASPVWPNAGLALAAVLVLGPRVWPGIAVGAYLANVVLAIDHGFSAPVALLSSVAIAAGNTVEALLGGYLIQRFAGGAEFLDRAERVFFFSGFAAPLSTLVSALSGATTLGVAGIVSWPLWPSVWCTWWLGDLTGLLVVTPLLLAWTRRPLPKADGRDIGEIVIALAALVGIAGVVFVAGYPVAYLFVPFVLWAAFRYGARGAATMTFLIAALATWGTILREGPFVHGALNESLLFLQAFVGVLAVMSMALAAALTERRRSEALLADNNRQLEEQIGVAREASLAAQRARRRAEEAAVKAEGANRAKSEFLAVMSHELRTPLNAILGYTDLIADEVVGPLNTIQKDQLDRVRSNGKHLIGLIEGLLTLARIEAGKIELHVQTVDAVSLARQSAALLQEAMATKGLRFDLEIDERPQLIDTDATKVRQILINLLSNAIKFTERGAIALSVRDDRDQIVFQVMDTGTGIRQEDQVQIFEAFWQADQSMTRKSGGAGLGLSVSRELARLLGGDVTVSSTLGSGSTFTVVLPRRAAGPDDGATARLDDRGDAQPATTGQTG